jgi:hypothetical protein
MDQWILALMRRGSIRSRRASRGSANFAETTAVANGLCDACARRPDLRDRVLAYYRANLFDDSMRILPAIAPGSPVRN